MVVVLLVFLLSLFVRAVAGERLIMRFPLNPEFLSLLKFTGIKEICFQGRRGQWKTKESLPHNYIKQQDISLSIRVTVCTKGSRLILFSISKQLLIGLGKVYNLVGGGGGGRGNHHPPQEKQPLEKISPLQKMYGRLIPCFIPPSVRIKEIQINTNKLGLLCS